MQLRRKFLHPLRLTCTKQYTCQRSNVSSPCTLRNHQPRSENQGFSKGSQGLYLERICKVSSLLKCLYLSLRHIFGIKHKNDNERFCSNTLLLTQFSIRTNSLLFIFVSGYVPKSNALIEDKQKIFVICLPGRPETALHHGQHLVSIIFYRKLVASLNKL